MILLYKKVHIKNLSQVFPLNYQPVFDYWHRAQCNLTSIIISTSFEYYANNCSKKGIIGIAVKRIKLQQKMI